MGHICDLSNDSVTHIVKDGIEYIQFNHFNRYSDIINHCFSTRRGGVSVGQYSSLNLGVNSDDSKQNLDENYRRLCEAVGISTDNLAFSKQVHGTNIVAINSANANAFTGTDREQCDGFATNQRNITLVTLYADCVPIYLFDPVKKAIAIVHSGWRGTISKIAVKGVEFLVNKFYSNPMDILAGIGPSIGKCCFEVEDDIANMYREAFPNYTDIIYPHKQQQNKYNVDLWKCNLSMLINCGLKPDNIKIAQICTVCNHDLFFSHRASNGEKGRGAGIMQLI